MVTTRDHIVLTVSDESVEQEFIRLVLVLVLHHNIVVDPGDLVDVVRSTFKLHAHFYFNLQINIISVALFNVTSFLCRNAKHYFIHNFI